MNLDGEKRMENFLSDVEQRNLVQELSQGKELAKQLHIHLLQSSNSPEAGRVLLDEILVSFEQALSVLTHGRGGAIGSSVAAMLVADPTLHSLTGTDVSDHESKDQATRKRWTRKVEVRGETGMEGQLDDGYGWRKYGQKDILGAKYPRGYYRCSHRSGQGCLATKQTQRSSHDPNILDITYSGDHTCDPAGNPSPIDPPIPSYKPLTQLEETLSLHQNNHQFLPQSQQPFFSVQTSPKVVSQDLHTFNFTSSSNIQPQNCTTRQVNISESESGRIVANSAAYGVNSPPPDIDFPLGIPYEFGLNFTFQNYRK